jgi:hypothetical protein
MAGLPRRQGKRQRDGLQGGRLAGTIVADQAGQAPWDASFVGCEWYVKGFYSLEILDVNV